MLVVEPLHKRGQKTAGKVLEHQHLVKILAQGLVNNCKQFCLAHRYRTTEFFGESVQRSGTPAEKGSSCDGGDEGKHGSNPVLAVDALMALNRLIPP